MRCGRKGVYSLFVCEDKRKTKKATGETARGLLLVPSKKGEITNQKGISAVLWTHQQEKSLKGIDSAPRIGLPLKLRCFAATPIPLLGCESHVLLQWGLLARIKGFEPLQLGLEASVLPLYEIRVTKIQKKAPPSWGSCFPVCSGRGRMRIGHTLTCPIGGGYSAALRSNVFKKGSS